MTDIERVATETARAFDAAIVRARRDYNNDTAVDVAHAISHIVRAVGHGGDREEQRDILHTIIETALKLQAISQGIFK